MNPQLLKEIDGLKLELQENHSLCQAASVERDKLAQLVQVLQQRSHLRLLPDATAIFIK